MRIRTVVLIAVLALLAAGGYALAAYNSYFDAQAACSRAAEGRPAGQALSHLREVARKRSARIVEAGEWTTAVFRATIGSGFACVLRVHDGKLVEFRVAGASEVEQKK
jgi:hypothetical protein